MSKVISKDGTSIAFDQTGDGPPLILVDGAMCCRAMGPMPKLAALLAAHFTVIAYDRRGRNHSGDTRPYAVEREIEDLDALIQHVGGSAFVVGLSSGAALALQAAASGLNIRKLALYEPPYVPDMSGYAAHVTALIAADRRSDAVKLFMRYVGMPGLLIAVMRLLPLWAKVKAVAHTLPYDAAVMGDGRLSERVARAVRTPLLVLGGEKSQQRLRLAVQAVGQAIPHARIHMLKGQSHNVSLPILAPVLQAFFIPHPNPAKETP